MTAKRKRRIVVLAVVVAAACIFHAPLLRGLAGFLIVDQPIGDYDCVCLCAWGDNPNGDRCYDVAADLYRRKPSCRVLLVAPNPNRLEEIGAIPSLASKTRRALSARGVPQDTVSVLPGERWNDWATARFFAGRSAEAEGGYRRALEMNSQNAQAAENMGALLTSQGRSDEAIPFLETAIFLAGERASPALTQLLADSRMAAAMVQKDELARLNRSYNGLTRSLALQSLALDRALFRLTTLSLEVIQATERMSKSIVDAKTARKTSNGR
jgi:tetratricopeptide (TPR) repeat protein